MQLQQQQEKSSGGLNLSWAKKPVEPKKVKSLAEIQAEEQEKMAKVNNNQTELYINLMSLFLRFSKLQRLVYRKKRRLQSPQTLTVFGMVPT